MNEAPPTPSAPPIPTGGKKFREMARASWIAPLIAFGVNAFVLNSQRGTSEPVGRTVQMIIGPTFVLVGLVFGIVALFGIRKFGKPGILGPALIGIGINLLLIVMGALPILLHVANRVRLQPAIHSPSAYTLKNDALRFSIDVPEGFRDWPEAKQAPKVEHVYVKGVVGGGEALTVINIERLGGLIPKNKPLSKKNLPSGSDAEITTRNWRGVKVDTIIANAEQNGFKIVVYVVQVPLKPSAIQLNVGGPASKREELGQLADTLLASLEGETNW